MDFDSVYSIRKQIKDLSKEELEKAFLDLSDDWLHVADDLNHANAIIDGSWPTADEIINEVRRQQKQTF